MSKKEYNQDGSHIDSVVQNHQCCFCGTCRAVCPAGAIKMDYEGSFPVPVVNQSKCTRCGLCLKICPGHSVDLPALTKEFLGHDYDNPLAGYHLSCFTGSVSDKTSRHNRTSGGLAKEIACWGLQKNHWQAVAISRFSDKGFCRTETVLTSDIEHVARADSSLYCPVTAGTVIEQIRQSPDKVCFIGLPCHIHAIRKAQNFLPDLKEKIIFTIGLFCSGTPGVDATRCFLRSHRIRPEDTSSLAYRSAGWPGDIEVSLKDKQEPLRFPRGKANTFINHLKFAVAFHHGGAFYHPRCSACPDYFAELADISLGDAWNLGLDSSHGGYNVGLIRTQKARQLLDQMNQSGTIEYQPLTVEKLLQSHHPCVQTKKNLKPVLDAYERSGYDQPRFPGQPEGFSHFSLRWLSRLRSLQMKCAKYPAAWSFLWLLTLLEGILKQQEKRLYRTKDICKTDS